MVIYTDYIDVFKCLSVIGVPWVALMIGAQFGQLESTKIFSLIYVTGMALHICYLSAKINKLLNLPVIFITKFSFSFIWMFSFVQVLNPSGKNARERQGNRPAAVIVLMFITPIINLFILNDIGKEMINDATGL